MNKARVQTSMALIFGTDIRSSQHRYAISSRQRHASRRIGWHNDNDFDLSVPNGPCTLRDTVRRDVPRTGRGEATSWVRLHVELAISWSGESQSAYRPV